MNRVPRPHAINPPPRHARIPSPQTDAATAAAVRASRPLPMRSPKDSGGPSCAATPPATTAAAAAHRARVDAYTPDAPGAPRPYSLRLAEAEGWSREHALAVLREYKRFAYLAVAAGHPVTPSKAIDAAWHLHLQYTHAYWNVFCADVLGAPLHHFPGDGRPGEDAHHDGHYRQTLDSYRRIYGEAPPAAIWPTGSAPADDHAEHGKRAASRPRWLTPRRPIWLAIGVGATAAGSAACAENLDVLNYSGSSFLSLYFMICGLALAAIAGLQFLTWYFRPFGANGSNGIRELTAAETAYAAGGEARMAHVLVLSMLHSGAIEIERGGKPSVTMVTALKPPNTLEEHFAWGWLAGQPGSTASYASFHRKLIEKARSVRDKLNAGGWRWAEREMHRTRLVSRGLALAVIGLGVTKIVIGVTRDRPVGYLVFGVIAFYFCYCFLRDRLTGFGRSGPTRGATEALDRQRASREEWRQQPAADLGSTLLWSAALFGAGALAGSAWDAQAAMVEAEQQRVAAMMRGTGGGGGGGSSDSTGGSSCTTSSSCSGGGSCGSSGCGGCSSSSSSD